jgi:hypothetical protein
MRETPASRDTSRIVGRRVGRAASPLPLAELFFVDRLMIVPTRGERKLRSRNYGGEPRYSGFASPTT